MYHRILGLTGWMLFLQGVAGAQTTLPNAEQLTKDLTELRQRLANTAENVQILAEQVATNTATGSRHADDLTRLAGSVSEELQIQKELLARIETSLQQQQDQLAQQQALLEAITRKDAAGRDVLQLNALATQSDEFREDLRNAVRQALDRHGEFAIWNRMGTPQQVTVNQKSYAIAADEILMLTVPVGTVTAQLPGQPITNWTLDGPHYRRKIEIVAEEEPAPTSVARPIMEAAGGPLVPLPLPVMPLPLPPTVELSPALPSPAAGY